MLPFPDDVTSCRGDDCPLRQTCWRHLVPRQVLQSYYVVVPYDHEVGGCDAYWPTEERE